MPRQTERMEVVARQPHREMEFHLIKNRTIIVMQACLIKILSNFSKISLLLEHSKKKEKKEGYREVSF